MRLPVDGLSWVNCLNCMLWAHSKKGEKMLIKVMCLQNIACKCLLPGNLFSGVLTFMIV